MSQRSVERQPVVRLDEVPLQPFTNGGSFEAQVCLLGPSLSLRGLGCMLTIVPPGKRAFPFHRHHILDELFVVLAGEGVYRCGERTYPVRAGDVISAPAGGEAHQLINTGDVELRYLGISTRSEADIVEYPDSGKVSYRAGVIGGDVQTASINFRGRPGEPLDYFDGEPD